MRHSHRKAAEHQHHQQAAQEQRAYQIVERDLDEVGRAEDRGVHLDAGQTRAQLVESVFDAPGHVQRVGPREFFDDQHQSRTIVDHRITDERPGGLLHVGHVLQEQR